MSSVSCSSTLVGHNGWVTSVCFRANTLVTASRDRTLLIWDILDNAEGYAKPKRRLTGHSHFVQDMSLSIDGQFAVTAAWDGSVRLWNLIKGVSAKQMVGHTKDVLSVTFSPDNRTIYSGSRDHTIKIWNTLSECRATLPNHQDWVSCVRCSSGSNNYIITGSWDKTIRVYDPADMNKTKFVLHNNAPVTCLDVAPDGSLCATGGKDGIVHLWDLNDGKVTEELDAGDAVNAVCFSPKNYWLCAATRKGIRIWDLEKNSVVHELDKSHENFQIRYRHPNPDCLSLCWNETGDILFAGYNDYAIRVWKFTA